MDPVTKADLQRFAPHALPDQLDLLAAGWGAMTEAGITAGPLRWCHFLAQTACETGGFRLVRENTGWSRAQMKALWPARFPLGKADPRILAARDDPRRLANLAYSHRKDIGNEGGDDGWLYRGGGLLQLTGRDAYRRAGQAIGVDLEAEPDLIEQPEVSLSAAIWVWGLHPNNAFADHGYLRAIGNAVNRGNPWSGLEPIGAEHRKAWLDRALAIWGSGQLPADGTLHLGASGRRVLQVQARLRDLGYATGAADGVLGPATARAIAGFKLDARRAGRDTEPEEAVGPLTLAALEDADPAPLSPDRREASERDLAAAGSTEVAAGRRAKAAGQAALYTGLAAGAEKAGLMDQVRDLASGFPALHRTVAPAVAALQWGLRHFWWVLLIAGGCWAWMAFRDVIRSRLDAHRSGANLSR